ncbi:MAG: hypothetical protein RID91_08575 [Azospirillaceae bacterium]
MSGRDAARAFGFMAAVAALAVPLMLPDHPGVLKTGLVVFFPLELPVLVLTLALAPTGGPVSIAVRAVVVAALALRAVLAAADFGTWMALGRPFNPAYDAKLLVDGHNLLVGAIGAVPAALAILGAVALVGLGLFGLWAATGRLAGWRPPRPAAAIALVPMLALAGGDMARSTLPVDPPGDAFAARGLLSHAEAVVEARTARRDLMRVAADDAFAAVPGDALMPALDGTDVIVAFVESYGRTTHDNPLYAESVLPTLAAAERDLRGAGLAARSAWLTAPTVGGQSWLSHATLLSGLWIDSQPRYDALMASDRATLIHLADRAGRRTAAVMPAITMAWPEAGYFGYDAVYASDDLGYRGPPFNWVTMPDQYTWTALERLTLEGREGRADAFVEVALISSHAPWTPVPELIDWTAVDDGRVFADMAASGDPPEVVWRDRDRVRAQFGASVVYALETAASFAARQGRAPGRVRLIVLLGDHQPAGFVAQDHGGRDVPVHLIGPPSLVDRFAAAGWEAGLRPSGEAPVWRMDAFRDHFLAAFGPDPAAPATVGQLDP